MPVWRYSALDWLFLCPCPGGDPVTNPQLLNDVTRVRLPQPLKVALTMTAQQRGVSVSDVIRLAVARDLAGVPNSPQKPQNAQ